MSYIETTKDLNTLVDKLANLIIDTFKCCTRNYEALLPYLGKKETNSKIHHKLVQINILLNKLSEELLELRVEYVTNSSCEHKGEIIPSEGGRKRRMTDMLEFGGHEAKNIKLEAPFFNSTKCSTALNSETGINLQSEKLVLVDTEESNNTHVQNLEWQEKKNLKTGIQYSNEIEDIRELSVTSCHIPVAQKSCDTTNNRMPVCFDGDEVSASVVDGLACDKSADTIIQRENGEVCVQLQSVKSETQNEEKCADSANVLSEDTETLRDEVGCTTLASSQVKLPADDKESPVVFTTCDSESATLVEERANTCKKEEERALHSPKKYKLKGGPVQRSVEVCSAEGELYGVKRHKKKSFKCTLCKCVFSGGSSLASHVTGKKHQKNLAAKIGYAKLPEVPNNNCESAAAVLLLNAVSRSLTDTVKSNSLLGEAPVPVCSAVTSSVAGNGLLGESPVPVCSAVTNSFAGNGLLGESPVPVCSAVTYSVADTLPSYGCDSSESDSACSAVACSLADTVTIVEHRYQALLTKHSIKLESIWTYFDAPLHINKKYIMFHSGKLICYLCYEEVGKNILNVRKHISGLNHVNRMNILRNIQLENKSSDNQLLDIPGSLENIVPTTQFSVSNNGFFCSVCKYFCENTVVLSHMTGEVHRKRLDVMKKLG